MAAIFLLRSNLADVIAICTLLLGVLCPCPVIQGQSTTLRFTVVLYTSNVTEDATVGSTVLTVTAEPVGTPPPACSSITYSTIPSILEHFTVQSNGTIVLKEHLDFETQRFHIFQVVAQDACSQAMAEVNITVLNVNDTAPLCAHHVMFFSISESTPPATNTTFSLHCTDPDEPNSAVMYNIITGDTFGVLPDGHLSVLSQLDYESHTQHLLFINVTKANYPSAVTRVTVVVTVLPSNEFPPVFSSSVELSYNISESLPIGSIIGNITAEDDDNGSDGIVTYLTTHECFTIDPVSGSLALLCALDREVKDIYYVTVLAKDNPTNDSFQLSSNITVEVNVLDVNDNTPQFPHSLYTLSVLETASVGTVLLALHCSDADENYMITYRIVDGDWLNHFSVNSTSGNLSIGSHLNYESQQFYHLKVQCSDEGLLSSMASVVIQVINVDEHDPVIQSRRLYRVAEDTPVGSVIATVSATDADAGLAGEIIFSINKTNNDVYCPEELFKIDPTSGSLYLLATLDKELELSFVPPAADHTYQCALTVSNQLPDGRQATDVIRLSVINVNDIVPACDQHVIAVEIFEDFVIGDSICSFVCHDDDSPSLTYTITNPSTPFIVTHNSTHVIIQLSAQLDYEAQTQYSFEVMISDMGMPTLSTTVAVHVNVKDIDEYAPVFVTVNDSINVPEDARVGTILYTFIATDSDDDHGNVHYTIAEENRLVVLDEITGLLYLAAPLDHEAMGEFHLTVQAGDVDPLSATAYLHVSISDVNDNVPEFSSIVYFISLVETAPIGTSFDLPICTDQDDGFNSLLSCQTSSSCSHAYDGPCVTIDSPPFSFNFTTGEGILLSTLDYEVATLYVFEIICTDQGSPQLSASAVVNVEVAPVNEFTPYFDLPYYNVTVSEDVTIGSSIVMLAASDLDAGLDGELSYSLSSHHFAIDPNTGVLYVTQPLDREQEMSYSIQIIASDSSPNVSRSSHINVYIAVDDVNDNHPFCEQEIVTVRISELSTVGSSIIQLNCTDIDHPSILHYTIISGNEHGSFTIYDNGTIILSALLNMHEYHLTVSVSDVASPPLSVIVSCYIHVYGVNRPPIFDYSQPLNVSLPLSILPGSLLLTVTASDQDDVISYSIYPTASYLKIDQWSGIIYLISGLQRNQTGYHIFILTAMDTVGLSATLNLTVEVIDDTYYSVRFNQSLYFVSVAEGGSINTTLLTVHCTNNYGEDVDNLQYSITEPNSLFHIAQSTGELSNSGPLDYELQVDHNVSIVCVDPTAQSQHNSTAVVIVTVLPINEHPPILTFNTLEVAMTESSAVGQPIVQVNATDQDRDSQLRYHLKENFNSFHLDAISGVLYLIQSLDYESRVSYNLSVTVVDEVAHSSVGYIILHVLDANDNRPVCDSSFITKIVMDDAQVGQAVATLNCTDSDSDINSQLQFSVVHNNSDVFAVNESTGEIFVVHALSTFTYSCFLIILVSDKGTAALNSTVAIEISIQQQLQPVDPSDEVISAEDEGVSNSLMVNITHLTLELWLNGAREKFLNATARAITYFCAINSLSCSLVPFCVSIPEAIVANKKSFVVEFSSEDIVVYSTNVSGDAITIQFYVSLPEGASKPEDATTTHVLPLATLQQVFTDNGDIILGYTSSSPLLDAITSSDQSKCKDLFIGGGAAVITFGFILTFLLCLGLAVFKWKQKKSVRIAPIAPLTVRSGTVSSFKLSSLRDQYFTSDTDTDMASMENHASQRSSLDGMDSTSQSVTSQDSHQEEWPWVSPTALRPLSIPNKPIAVWINR